MTTVEYDLDTSGGLMPQIQALIAPPASEEGGKKKKEREYRYRRPGRAVNHDCCDSCKEGGDLICCDRCPAAFHLQCHDPPLSDDDIPIGEWLCHKCKCTPLEEEDRASTSSSQSRQSSTKSNSKEKLEVEMDRCSSSGACSPVPMEVEEESNNPLQILIKAASVMNPQQFQLPNELVCTTQLPGSSKRVRSKEGSRSGPKKLAHELDNGIVPLPAKLCFQCRRSCRKAPLIQCDYCPLLFHADCLDPPLTTLPTGRWMCPNHAEHILDEKLLSSVSLTERVKLYEKYTGFVNQDTVKLEFLKKIHRQNPPFRYKKKLPQRKRMQVPNSVKEHYKHPPLLLPRITEPPPQIFQNKSLTTFASSSSLPLTSSSLAPTSEEQNEWLSSVISLQTSIARFLAQKQLNANRTETESKEAKLPGCATAFTTSSSTCPSPAASVAFSNVSFVETKSCENKLASNINSSLQNFKGILCANTQLVQQNGPMSLLTQNASNTLAVNGDLELGDLSKEYSLSSSSKIKSECDETVFAPKSVPCCISRTLSPVPAHCVTNARVVPNQAKSIVNAASKPNNVALVTRVNRWTPQTSKPSSVTLTNASYTGANLTSGSSILNSAAAANSPVTSRIAASTISSVTAVGSQPSFRSTPILRPLVNSGTQPASGTPRIVTVHTIGKTSASCGTTPTKVSIATSLSSSPAILNLNSTLQACIDGTGDIELSKLDERLIHILAWQRLQQLLPAKSTASQSTKKTTNGIVNPASTEVRARAVLCPLTGKGPAVPMPYRTLNIGTGADMEVCLTNFGHCNFVSSKHACIFYDEITKHYELLNYSEHGTTVDNVLYSCDFSDKHVQPPPATSIVASVRNLIDKKRKIPDPGLPERPVMSSRAGETWKPCSCKASSSSLIGGSGAGWEGTALLHHGSYIKCGCLQFVFSIAEYGSSKIDPNAATERKSDILTSLMHKNS